MLKSLSPGILARRAVVSKLGFTWMPDRLRSFSRVFQRLSTAINGGAYCAAVEGSDLVLHYRANARNKSKLNDTIINIFSHNARGMVRDEHMEEGIGFMERGKAFATCFQETWKLGDTIEEHNGHVILNHGPEKKLCRRGSLGVAIVLAPAARAAWEKAGSQQLYFGPRIIVTHAPTI